MKRANENGMEVNISALLAICFHIIDSLNSNKIFLLVSELIQYVNKVEAR